ncbi:MAG: four helix bundle protein, partial [Planctomycetaceae bacterium]
PRSFLQYLWIANGSLAEVETQVLLSIDLEFIGENEALSVIDLTQQVGRMLTGLRRSIESQLP